MEDRERRRRLSHSLVASLLSVLATALSIAVMQSLTVTSRPFTIAVTVAFIAAVLLTLALVYLDAYLRDLRELFRDLRLAQRTAHVVPDIARFRSREDIITLHANGDGEVAWIFELVSRPEEPVSELAFPFFYYNSPLATGDPTVSVQTITVNDEAIPVEAAFAHLEHREMVSEEARAMHGGDQFVEYGMLRVPVSFSVSRPVCRVLVKFALRNVFHDPVNRIYVDIPYVTERLRVSIHSPQGITRRATAVSGHSVVARTAMQALDAIESRTQSTSCQQEGDTVVWESASLKLGYQYVVHVRRERQTPTSPMGEVSADHPSSS